MESHRLYNRIYLVASYLIITSCSIIVAGIYLLQQPFTDLSWLIIISDFAITIISIFLIILNFIQNDGYIRKALTIGLKNIMTIWAGLQTVLIFQLNTGRLGIITIQNSNNLQPLQVLFYIVIIIQLVSICIVIFYHYQLYNCFQLRFIFLIECIFTLTYSTFTTVFIFALVESLPQHTIWTVILITINSIISISVIIMILLNVCKIKLQKIKYFYIFIVLIIFIAAAALPELLNNIQKGQLFLSNHQCTTVISKISQTQLKGVCQKYVIKQSGQLQQVCSKVFRTLAWQQQRTNKTKSSPLIRACINRDCCEIKQTLYLGNLAMVLLGQFCLVFSLGFVIYTDWLLIKQDEYQQSKLQKCIGISIILLGICLSGSLILIHLVKSHPFQIIVNSD